THFVAGMGTGGTISGVGRYLKEKNPKVKVFGVDPIGSLYYEKLKKNKIGVAKSYVVEGIGEDFFPTTCDLGLIDDVIQVTDRDCFIYTRKLARMEGLFCGGSAGAALWGGLKFAEKLGKKDLMVILLPDTGMRYLSKIYNDEWMREGQYFEADIHLQAKDVLQFKQALKGERKLVMATPQDTLLAALERMRKQDISQLPVFENGKAVGAVFEDAILNLLLKGREIKKMVVREIMGHALPVVNPEARIEYIMRLVTPESPAVLVQAAKGHYQIITKYDIVNAVSRFAEPGPNGHN
ncbi:MAG: pyridoxal-phosphate dependent enzyme, partial [Elusimicrobia bacterium]|nr:pyridoxal-phosphate dependent enzyme [Elusimicrobiota bacterium]